MSDERRLDHPVFYFIEIWARGTTPNLSFEGRVSNVAHNTWSVSRDMSVTIHVFE